MNFKIFIDQIQNTKSSYEVKKLIYFFFEEHPILTTKEHRVFMQIKKASDWVEDSCLNVFKEDCVYWYENIEEF